MWIGSLAKDYGEAVVARGLSSPDWMMELWSSKNGETWTILMVNKNGMACSLSGGEALQNYNWEAPVLHQKYTPANFSGEIIPIKTNTTGDIVIVGVYCPDRESFDKHWEVGVNGDPGMAGEVLRELIVQEECIRTKTMLELVEMIGAIPWREGQFEGWEAKFFDGRPAYIVIYNGN